MSMVRFATTCDTPTCRKRSDEYTAWPSCLVCMQDFCPEHGRKTREADVDQSEAGICFDCEQKGFEP